MTKAQPEGLALAVMVGGHEGSVRETWVQALVLARSIRRFAGRHSEGRILVLYPDREDRQAPDVRLRLEALGAEVLPFQANTQALAFPFAAKVSAAAVAEGHVQGSASVLFWMDSDTLVLKDLDVLLLGPSFDLGYRPVHIANVGSRFDEPVDAFWSAIYRACGTPEGSVFPMETCVGREKIRPYVNAGCLVVRPEKGLLGGWSRRFFELYRAPDLAAFYEKDERYPIFFHQAVLAGTILASIDRSCMQELPEFVNYPRHLHTEYEKARRPGRLNDLITCRYEASFPVNRWESDLFPVEEPLSGWIREQLRDVESLLDPERTARRRRELDEEGIRI